MSKKNIAIPWLTLFCCNQVVVDVVRNTPFASDPPFVMSAAYWVAVAVRANTVLRGVQIANRLRKEVRWFDAIKTDKRSVQIANKLLKQVLLDVHIYPMC